MSVSDGTSKGTPSNSQRSSKSQGQVILDEPTNLHNKKSKATIGTAYHMEESRRLLQQMPGQAQASPAILAFFQGTDHLFVKKCKELPKELLKIRPNISREIWNSSCRTIYYASAQGKKCCNGFVYRVVDYNNNPVITVTGHQTGPGIKSSATICLGDGAEIGTISQEFCDASYTIKDGNNTIVYKIQGPCFGTCTPCVFWCCDEHFEIDMADGVTDVGLISAHWKNSHQEARGTFGLSFPIKLETQHKALLLGSAFLIHYQYYSCGGNGTCALLFYLIVAVTVLASLGRWQFHWY